MTSESLRGALALLVVLTLVAPRSASAEDWGPTRFSARWDNDLFGGADRHYTNGVEFALAGRVPPGALSFFLGEEGGAWELNFAQSIYTPELLEEERVVLEDRPYAGWLRLGVSVSRRNLPWRLQDRVGLEFGLLGPPSGAEAAQRLVHETLTGSSAPRGWRNQLSTEVGVRVHYELRHRAWRDELLGLDWELEPWVGASGGNVVIDASLGGRLRLGRVPDAFALVEVPGNWSAFLTLGAELRLVGHDVFLEGSLIRPGHHHVRAHRLAFDLELGFTILLQGAISLSYTHTLRAPEFAAQEDWDQFGSLSLVVSL